MSEETVVAETTPVEEATPNTSSILDSEGAFTQAFRDSLSDDLGQHSIFEKYKTPEAMIKGTINAQKMTGQKIEEFWNSEDEGIVAKKRELIGAVKSADEIAFDVSDLPESMREVASSQYTRLSEIAAEKGWPKSVIEEVIALDKQRALEVNDQIGVDTQQAQQEAESELRKEWTGVKFDENIEKTIKTLNHLGLGEMAEDPAFGNNPKYIKLFFDNIVPLIANDSIIEGKQRHDVSTAREMLSDIDREMMDWSGSTQDPHYQNLMKKKLDILTKMS